MLNKGSEGVRTLSSPLPNFTHSMHRLRPCNRCRRRKLYYIRLTAVVLKFYLSFQINNELGLSHFFMLFFFFTTSWRKPSADFQGCICFMPVFVKRVVCPLCLSSHLYFVVKIFQPWQHFFFLESNKTVSLAFRSRRRDRLITRGNLVKASRTILLTSLF